MTVPSRYAPNLPLHPYTPIPTTGGNVYHIPQVVAETKWEVDLVGKKTVRGELVGGRLTPISLLQIFVELNFRAVFVLHSWG